MKKPSIPDLIPTPKEQDVKAYDYQEAFRRNRGFISQEEQNKLQNACIAVAGLGGVGGAQVEALARLGIGKFILADLDVYELSNFNRQMGADTGSVGRSKVKVSEEVVHSINPTAQVITIDTGISESTIEGFVKQADFILDALDFNCYNERFLLYKHARTSGKWVINVAPPGFGATIFLFDPKGMTFEDYFDLRPEMSLEEKSMALMFGIVPTPFPLKYLDRTTVRPGQGSFPCVSPAFFVAAGLAAAMVANLILDKCPRKPVPWVHQFDALLLRYKRKYYPWGMRSPWQRFKKFLIKRIVNPKKEAV